MEGVYSREDFTPGDPMAQPKALPDSLPEPVELN